LLKLRGRETICWWCWLSSPKFPATVKVNDTAPAVGSGAAIRKIKKANTLSGIM